MTAVVIAPRIEDPTNDTETVASSGYFKIRPSKAYVSAGQWVQPVWPKNQTNLTGSPVTVQLDPQPDVPYELFVNIPDGAGGRYKFTEFRIVAGAGPVAWETLTRVDGPGGDPVLTSVVDARLTALETSFGGVSGGASTLAGITNMSPLARLLNTDTTQAAMLSRIGAAATVHTHVATTDLTATGTKNTTTFLRGDNTWAVPPASDLTALNAQIALKAPLNPATGLVDANNIDPAIARQTDVTAAFASVVTPAWSSISGVPTGRTYVDLVLPGGVLAPRTSVVVPPGWAVNWVSPTPPPIGGPYMLAVDTYERASV